MSCGLQQKKIFWGIYYAQATCAVSLPCHQLPQLNSQYPLTVCIESCGIASNTYIIYKFNKFISHNGIHCIQLVIVISCCRLVWYVLYLRRLFACILAPALFCSVIDWIVGGCTMTKDYSSRCSRIWTTPTTPRHSRNNRPIGHRYYMCPKGNSMECTCRPWAKTKLQNVESGLPPSTVMVSVVGCWGLRQINTSGIECGMNTGALVSHPPHWNNLTECGLIIIYIWQRSI